MPAVAFGTWRLWAKEAYQPVRWALELGYRHIDTAEGYANEAEIGRALRDSGVPRSEVFLATKASSIPRGLADISLAEEIFQEQLRQLGTDYVDLYMLHSVPQNRQEMMALWRVLERLFDSGRARALGVSNCDARELRALLDEARVPPAYLQNLYKIYKPGEQLPADEDTVLLAQANRIAVMGYSGQTDWPHVLPPLLDPHVLSVAAKHGRTASQVLHRWALQRGVGVLPKSARRERIAENARLFDFELDEASMRLLDGLATLSESGATAPTKPGHLEDVYGLSSLSQPAPPAAVAWTQDEVAVPQEAVGRGFEFRAAQAYLLGPAENVAPASCRQRCLQRPECRGWEVCAPYDAAQGCEGCYLVGAAPGLTTVHVAGWYGAVERS